MSREESAAEARALLNTICIVHDSELVRVVGFHEDALDYYWRVRCRDRDARNGRTEWYATFVGACVGLTDMPRYDQLEADFTRNGCPPVPEFLDTTAGRAENHRFYGAMSVDGHHPDTDRIELTNLDPERPVWFAILRRDHEEIVSVEEHDGEGHVVHERPVDGDWACLVAGRVAARGGDDEAIKRAIERCGAECSEAERDYPEITQERRAMRRRVEAEQG